jgi:hypothetical protein
VAVGVLAGVDELQGDGVVVRQPVLRLRVRNVDLVAQPGVDGEALAGLPVVLDERGVLELVIS